MENKKSNVIRKKIRTIKVTWTTLNMNHFIAIRYGPSTFATTTASPTEAADILSHEFAHTRYQLSHVRLRFSIILPVSHFEMRFTSTQRRLNVYMGFNMPPLLSTFVCVDFENRQRFPWFDTRFVGVISANGNNTPNAHARRTNIQHTRNNLFNGLPLSNL